MPGQAVVTFPVETRELDHGRPWSAPTVSVHDDTAGLADAAFGHRIEGLPGGALMPPGAVLRFLGLECAPGSAFLLVRVDRVLGHSTHEALLRPARRGFDRRLHLTAAGRRAEARLHPGPRPSAPFAPALSAVAAQRYLDNFAEFGTHFVSSVSFGDAILQAFAFEPAELRRLLRETGGGPGERVLTREHALACSALIKRQLVRAAGPVLSLNRDPALAAAVARGDFHSDQADGPSLLEPFARRGSAATELLRDARTAAPLALELTPVHRFHEFYRAVNEQRLLAGALCQVFGMRIDLPLPPPAAPAGVSDLLLRPPPGGWDGGRRLTAYHERIGADDLAALPRQLESCVVACHTLELREHETVVLAGEQVLIAAHTLLSRARSSRRMPELSCPDSAVDHLALIAHRMRGMLRLTAASTGERHTVIDGIRLAGDADGLRVHAVTDQPTARQLALAAPPLRLALRTAERLLGRPGGDGTSAHAAAMELLDWMTSLPPLDDLAGRAAAIRRAASTFEPRLAGRAEFERYLSGVLDAALTGDVIQARRAHERFWGSGPSPARPADLPAGVTHGTLARNELHLLRAHALSAAQPSSSQQPCTTSSGVSE